MNIFSKRFRICDRNNTWKFKRTFYNFGKFPGGKYEKKVAVLK